jgi:hypothetical protein
VQDGLFEGEEDGIVKCETNDVDLGQLEALITETHCDPEDIDYRAAALHQVRQLNRCLAALKTGLH